MAALCRLRSVIPVRRATLASPKVGTAEICRFLSTSDKKQDGADASTSSKSATSNLPDLPKRWVSWGFDHNDYYKDRAYAHIVHFSTISLGVVFFCYLMYYYPDMSDVEWTRREAFLELRRREAAGLPVIDPNYVPPSQIKLPSDEELGSYEIII